MFRGILTFSTCDMSAKALRSRAIEYNLGVERLNLSISTSTLLYIGPLYHFILFYFIFCFFFSLGPFLRHTEASGLGAE